MKPILFDLPEMIRTPRLIIRSPLPGDGAELNRAVHDSLKELSPWMPWARTPPSLEDSEESVRRAHARFLLREDLRYPFFDAETGQMLGSSGLHRIVWSLPAFEVGYWVRSGYQGKGYVTEAVNALTRFAFDFFKARRVEIRCNPLNARSAAVATRLGFDFEGKLRNDNFYVTDDYPRDTWVYSRINSDGLPPLDVRW